MKFGHDTHLALGAAVALANSALAPDTLDSIAALDDFYDRWEYTGTRRGTQTELDEVRALRPRLRALLLASEDEAVAMVNSMLAEARALPQLTRHQGFDWHIHAIASDAPLVDRISVETAMAMIDVIRAGELARFGVCADDTCTGIVLDLSRNRSRRFCSTACGNRNAVAAYRARQAERTAG